MSYGGNGVKHFLADVFLPAGYPSSVSPGAPVLHMLRHPFILEFLCRLPAVSYSMTYPAAGPLMSSLLQAIRYTMLYRRFVAHCRD